MDTERLRDGQYSSGVKLALSLMEQVQQVNTRQGKLIVLFDI